MTVARQRRMVDQDGQIIEAGDVVIEVIGKDVVSYKIPKTPNARRAQQRKLARLRAKVRSN
jgi:hypothetical protein